MRQLTAKELNEHLKMADPAPVLLDVREPWEYQLCHIAGSTHIPMGQVPRSLDKLDREREVVVVCHHGVRSFQVAFLLEHAGFANVVNLQGGIDAWAREVDPDMATY